MEDTHGCQIVWKYLWYLIWASHKVGITLQLKNPEVNLLSTFTVDCTVMLTQHTHTHIDEQNRPSYYAFISCDLCLTPHMQDIRFPQWTLQDLRTVEYNVVSLVYPGIVKGQRAFIYLDSWTLKTKTLWTLEMLQTTHLDAHCCIPEHLNTQQFIFWNQNCLSTNV